MDSVNTTHIRIIDLEIIKRWSFGLKLCSSSHNPSRKPGDVCIHCTRVCVYKQSHQLHTSREWVIHTGRWSSAELAQTYAERTCFRFIVASLSGLESLPAFAVPGTTSLSSFMLITAAAGRGNQQLFPSIRRLPPNEIFQELAKFLTLL